MREKLIQDLVQKWRKAEDIFQDSQDDSEKFKVLEYQTKQNLTDSELKELNLILSSYGF